MTLTRLLGIRLDLLKYEDEQGLSFAERVWQENGAPCEPELLCDVLETILTRCVEEGICYPAIVLRRKKELQRGGWKPIVVGAKGVPKSASEGDQACSKCRGTGYVPIEGGRHEKFCECNGWVRSAATARVQ
jgi:hypothetical protein